MSALLDRLLAANAEHAAGHAPLLDARPQQSLAVLTCMDARIDPLAALGLRIGEAHVLRNAGARVTEDAVRSLALSTHALGVRTLVLLQHTQCGLAGTSDEELRARTGADLEFLAISDHAAALEADIQAVAATPALALVEAVAGWVYDVATGRITEHHRWARPVEG